MRSDTCSADVAAENALAGIARQGVQMARHDPIDYVGIRDIRHLVDLSALDLVDPGST